jgi:ABC-type nitrate/sulfonate/bicarbonate transport system substrate-binding protein
MTAFDNVVAYVEGQGEAPIGPQPQFFAFLGSDDSFLSLVAKAGISEPRDLRGRKISVDAATTGYAFALFDLLEQAGLGRDDYTIVRIGGMAQRFADLSEGDTAATLLSTPYDLLAEKAGLRVVQRLRRPYQGNVAAARRDWAEANAGLVTGFIRAYMAALTWLFDPANIAEACMILEQSVAGMTADLARASHRQMFAGDAGFFRDGRLDPAGMRKVLQLRTRYAVERRALGDAGKYVELCYREQAVAP